MDNAVEPGKNTNVGWIETFGGALLAPSSTMKALSQEADHGSLLGALLLVCLVFGLDGLRMTSSQHLEWALLNVPASITLGVTLWLCTAGVLAIVATCFRAPSRQIKAIFITIGWAFSPWIFVGPLSCYRAALGGAFVLFAIVPLIWVFILQIVAIAETFELKAWQTLILVFVAPVLLQTLSVLQFFQAVYVAASSFVS